MPAWVPWCLLVAITSPLALYWWQLIAAGSVAFDWRVFMEAGDRAWAGSRDLYDVTLGFRHSPVFAYAMPAIAWIGTLGVRLLALAAAAAMPTWPMRLLALASWPLAMDLQHGALITPIVLAAAWGLRGSRMGSIAFVVLTLLSPRPLMLPIAAFLLWRQPWLRLPALGLFTVHGAGVLLSGYAFDWIQVLLTVGADMVGTLLNLSPSRFIGAWWFPVGAALATWLTYRGRVGLAALAVNPYVLPHYLLFALLDLDPPKVNEDIGSGPPRGEAAHIGGAGRETS